MHRRHSTLLLAILVLAAGPLAAQQYADARGDITMALAGDAIITRSMSPYQEPRFLELVGLVRDATVGYVNAEILFHDYGDDIIPAAASGGTYVAAPPSMAKELAWLGFDMVSRANNHTMDYGVGGLLSTTRALEAAGLAQAGAGENLAEARSPAYVETPGGRVALISAASTFADFGRAGPQRKDVRGRPGLNPIRWERAYVLPREGFEALRTAAGSMGRRAPQGDTIRFMRETFIAGDAPAVRTWPDPDDLAAIQASVADAKRQANWVIVASHSHESAGDREVPADFIRAFAHGVIDAGADVFVAHGPHVLRGIEIYQGRPIFYSLANFIFQNETVELQPADNYANYGLDDDALPADFYDARNARPGGGFPGEALYWESVLALPSFRGGELAEVRLYPITLGHGLPRPQRGRPMLADAALGAKILERLQRLSEPFGTRIRVRDGVGVVEVR